MLSALSLANFGCGRTANKPSTDSSQVEQHGEAQGGDGGDGNDSPSGGTNNAGGSPPSAAGGATGFITGGSSNTGGSGFAVDQSCRADQTQCVGNVLYGCDLNRNMFTPLIDCSTGDKNRYCNPKGKSGAACDWRDCTPGESHCTSTWLYTCNADGHWLTRQDEKACPLPPGPDPICEPHTSVCANGVLTVCQDSGLAYSAPLACESGWHCIDQGEYDPCIRNACEPGTDACLGNQTGKCASDGQSLDPIALDCQALGKVCAGTGCVWSAEDQLAPEPDETDTTTGVTELLMVDVHSDRVLVKLTTQLELTSGGLLHWLVYEGGSTGYELLHDETSTISDSSLPLGASHLSSEPMTVPLKAGRRYAFGLSLVSAKGSFLRQGVQSGRALSFGNVYGGNSYEGDYQVLPADLDPNDFEPRIGITTTLPPH